MKKGKKFFFEFELSVELVSSEDVAGMGSCEGFADSRVTGMTNWGLSRPWALRSHCAQQRVSWESNGDNLGFCRSTESRLFHIC